MPKNQKIDTLFTTEIFGSKVLPMSLLLYNSAIPPHCPKYMVGLQCSQAHQTPGKRKSYLHFEQDKVVLFFNLYELPNNINLISG